MFAILNQRCQCRPGHVCRMDDGCIPKDILYSKLATGERATGRPTLRYKDACKRDLEACGISPADLEKATSDHTGWRSAVKAGVKLAEEKRETHWEDRKMRRQQRLQSPPAPNTPASCATDMQIQNWSPQPKPALQLYLRLTNWCKLHCLTRQTDAIITIIIPMVGRL